MLSGRLRLVVGDRDWVLGPGEVAEFDTSVGQTATADTDTVEASLPPDLALGTLHAPS